MEFSRVAEVTFDNPLTETSNDAMSQELETQMTEEDRRYRETVSKFICSIYVSTLAWFAINQHLIWDLIWSYFKMYSRVGIRDHVNCTQPLNWISRLAHLTFAPNMFSHTLTLTWLTFASTHTHTQTLIRRTRTLANAIIVPWHALYLQ